MKKSLIILLVLGVLLTLGLASCKNEVQVPSEELVSVSFEQAVSRALTATVQEFDKDDYFWYYAAAKTDSTGLISGQTAGYDYAHAVAVKSGKGLDGQVPGFSQGSWKFTLFAYGGDVAPTADQMGKFVYSGEATAVTLKKNGANTVSVTVNPAEQGKGTLFIDMANIKLSEASSASHNTVAPLVSITKTKDAQTYEMVAGTNIEYTADAGQWTVNVDYTDGDIIFATGTVIATVYPGLKTTVTGDVSELITYAQFDAIENPDIVKVTAGSTATAYDAIPTSGVVLSGTKETKTVKTTVAATDAQAIMTEMATNAGVGLDSNTKMSLALNVDPTAATETSITYDISMSATLSVTQGSETKSTVKDVDKLDNVVIVEISMQKDLQDVEVWHKTTKMTRVDSKDDLADGKFYYDAENGKLYICTSSFSPFSISYKFIEYAASLNGVKYKTLAAAIDAASSEKAQTVYLLKDVSADCITISKSLVLDLCGFKVTSRITADSGNVDIKNGKIIGRVDAYDSSVLTIEADVAITGQVVVWGDGVFGEAGCKTPVLNFYGKATNTGDSALSTNGTDKSGAAINIYEGAEITSTDDIAVYLPSGNTTIYGGKITGATAVYFKSGTLTVKDGEFVGNLSPADYEYYGNGANATGDALVIDSCGYPNGAPVAVINGGKFTGTKDAIGYYRYQESEKAKITVDGGKYNTDPSNYVAKGYCVVMDGSYYKVVPAVAKIGETYYASVAAAVAASEAGDTVIVLRDTVETLTINVNKNITIQGVDPENLVSVRKNSARLFNIESSATIKDLSLYASDEPIYVDIEDDEVVNLNNLNIDSGFKSIHVVSSGTVNVYDCISSGVYPTNLDVSNKYDALTFKAVDSEFYGWISWGTGTEKITFTNCSFGAGHNYSHMRPYVATTFDNCTFYGMTMDTHPDNISGVISFNSCRYVKDGESTSIVDKDSLLLLLDADYVRGKMAWEVDGDIVIDDRPTE